MDEPKRGAKKQSLYFPEQMLSEITEEAKRLDRSAFVGHSARVVAFQGGHSTIAEQ